jgi:predicted GIY-YIG superfamily endonuclease
VVDRGYVHAGVSIESGSCLVDLYSPKLYGTPKVHKPEMPLRPIVSSIGSIAYGAARVVAEILAPLVGNTKHHIKNSHHFVETIKNIKIPPGWTMISYDVKSLFTCIPIEEALIAARKRLTKDKTLSKRTPLTAERTLKLLEYCLTTTYFQYRDEFYQQTQGAAMGSPVSPIVANLYMEEFEKDAIRTAKHPPKIWLRYVDDTFVITQDQYIDELTTHINSRNTNIQFTIERPTDGKLPFLDCLVEHNSDYTIKTSVYRKPTHTDQYLNFKSHHHLSHKRSVVNTLINRADTIVSDQRDRVKEKRHITAVLSDNGYPPWALTPHKPKDKSKTEPKRQYINDFPTGIPYLEGTSDELCQIFRNHGINTFHKPFNSVRSLLVKPKDPTKDNEKCGLVYGLKCSCDQYYIGETSRAFGTRTKEHLKQEGTNITAMGEHLKATGHHLDTEKNKILARESGFWRRKYREGIEIHLARPGLNRDTGMYIPPIYHGLLAADLRPADREAW